MPLVETPHVTQSGLKQFSSRVEQSNRSVSPEVSSSVISLNPNGIAEKAPEPSVIESFTTSVSSFLSSSGVTDAVGKLASAADSFASGNIIEAASSVFSQAKAALFDKDTTDLTASNFKTPVKDPLLSTFGGSGQDDALGFILDPIKKGLSQFDFSEVEKLVDNLSDFTVVAERLGQALPAVQKDLENIKSAALELEKGFLVAGSGALDLLGSAAADTLGVALDDSGILSDVTDFIGDVAPTLSKITDGIETAVNIFTNDIPNIVSSIGEDIVDITSNASFTDINGIRSIASSVFDITGTVADIADGIKNQNLFNTITALSLKSGDKDLFTNITSSPSNWNNHTTKSSVSTVLSSVASSAAFRLVDQAIDYLGSSQVKTGETVVRSMIANPAATKSDVPVITSTASKVGIEIQDLPIAQKTEDGPIYLAPWLKQTSPTVGAELYPLKSLTSGRRVN